MLLQCCLSVFICVLASNGADHPDLYVLCFGRCAFFLIWGYFIIDLVIFRPWGCQIQKNFQKSNSNATALEIFFNSDSHRPPGQPFLIVSKGALHMHLSTHTGQVFRREVGNCLYPRGWAAYQQHYQCEAGGHHYELETHHTAVPNTNSVTSTIMTAYIHGVISSNI